jgi:hypothetical protein
VGGQGGRRTVVSSGGGCAGRGSKEASSIIRTPERSSVKAKETVRFERCSSANAITSSTRNSVKERPTKIECVCVWGEGVVFVLSIVISS